MNTFAKILRPVLAASLTTFLTTGCGLLRQATHEYGDETAAEESDHHYVMLIGSLGTTPEEGEIQSFTLHPVTMATEHTGTVSAASPSFMVLGKDRRTLFVTNETERESTLSSYKLDPSSGELSLISKTYTIGEGPTYVATNGSYMVSANYAGGSISLTESDSKGVLAPVDWHIQIGDKGVSHPHSAYFTSDGSQLFATDLGLDKVLHFGIHTDTPPITLDANQITLPKGSGPRHIILSNNDKFAYVVCEFTPQIFVYRNEDGVLTEIQRISTHRTGKSGGHIALSHDGRFLYSSHRDGGQDAIIAFRVDKQSGRLSYLSTTPTGRHPRHFAISPDDRYLAVAQREDSLVSFYMRDRKSGELTPMKKAIRTDRPVFILWESFDN